jgi:molybdopterin-guanine dinucleotide biosynthesis protein
VLLAPRELAMSVQSVEPPQWPYIIGVGGLTSNVGKTTLVCELLKAFPGWEAIKTTRGHYRSCGKDPHTCCVSDLLESEPVIHSGRELTYAPGKDTGRYWDAGAVNVHWVIATDDQVGAGIHDALGRVKARGVIVEGNSFVEHVHPDCFVMVARPDEMKIKVTARKVLGRASAFYFSGEIRADTRTQLDALLQLNDSLNGCSSQPVFTPSSLPELVALLRDLTLSVEDSLARANPNVG